MTSGEYSDATTDVVGVFDTRDAMVAAKEAHPELSHHYGWVAWEIPEANVLYDCETPECTDVLTTAETRATQELKDAEAERNARRLEEVARREREASDRHAEALVALRAHGALALCRLRVTSEAAHDRFGTAPSEVVDHLLNLLSDADLLARSDDPFHSARLPSLRRRFAYYAGLRDEMRGKLSDALDIEAFDEIFEKCLAQP